mgnify:CR=1 FL=1
MTQRKPRLISYARVSTQDQNPQLQIDALAKAGVSENHIHVEKVSGVSAKRPILDKAIKDCRRGDVLVVWKLDRFGRNTIDVLMRMEELTKRNIEFRSLTEAIDTTTPMGRVMATMAVAFAQMERDIISERTKEGIAAARQDGRMANAKLTPEVLAHAHERLAKGATIREIADDIGVTPQALYQHFPAGASKIVGRRRS